MKKVLFMMLMLLTATFVNAQITWNVKGGVGTSTMSFSESDVTSDSKLVWRLGLGLETPISNNLLFMPSLEVANKGMKMSESGDDWNFDSEISVTYLQIPLLLAYRIPLGSKNLTFKAGPYLAYGISCSGKVKEVYGGKVYEVDSSGFSKNGAKHFDAGITVGVGYEYRRFELGAEYEVGLANIVEKEDANDKLEVTNGAFYITLGYKF